MTTSTGLDTPAPKRPTRARSRRTRTTAAAAALIPNNNATAAGHAATATTSGDIEGAQRLLTSYLSGNRTRTINDSLLDFFAWGRSYVMKAQRPSAIARPAAARSAARPKTMAAGAR